MTNRVLIALGGNAMIGPDGDASPAAQQTAIARAAALIADLVADGTIVLLTHGNGPQVGNVLVKNELAAHVVPPVPLDWCGAQTQATIGFTIMNSLDAAMAARGVAQRTATVVTRTLVDPNDPGFARPTKPIGRFVTQEQAAALCAHGQTWEPRGDRGWRRIVASPEPLEIVDAPVVTALVDAGYVVVAAGGGGIPVGRQADGSLRGVEAVIDKDLAATVLAQAVGVDVLVVATDVENAVVGFGSDGARPLRRTTPGELRRLAAAGNFASGSMGPKVEAAARFVEAGGRRSVITSLHHIGEAVRGDAGTVVENDAPDHLSG